jgi:hypothetical protein
MTPSSFARMIFQRRTTVNFRWRAFERLPAPPIAESVAV